MVSLLKLATHYHVLFWFNREGSVNLTLNYVRSVFIQSASEFR